jgi:hypothetical protein
MYLYFLRSINIIKVGIATDFASRLDAIRRGNFHPIEVLRTYSHWDAHYIKHLERDIHEELSSVREHHEFFFFGPEVELIIDRLDREFFPERFSQDALSIPVQVQA